MKKNGKASKSKEFDLERGTRALLENMHSDIKKIAEAQSSHGDRLDKIEMAVKEIPAMKVDIRTISMAVGANSKAIESNSKDLKEIKSELHSMNMALMETSHEIKDHEKRIKKVEEKVFA